VSECGRAGGREGEFIERVGRSLAWRVGNGAEWRTSRSNLRLPRGAMWRFGAQDFLVDRDDGC
jgi:hypothetical protein